MNAIAKITEPLDERHQLGANNPPADPTPFEAVKVNIEDLLAEAHNWADGTTVESQAQADEASRLIEDLRLAAKAADDLRVQEKKPHDDAITEIQARYNVYIADPKTKNPGRVWKAIDALKACVKPFLDKLEAERRAEAERLRKEAEAAAAKAAEAARAAPASDLAAQEAAEELVGAAKHAAAVARQVETSRSQARGGSRAMGLRTTWTAVITDRRAAILHYMAEQPEEFVALAQRLADADVRAGKRHLPGVDVVEGTAL